MRRDLIIALINSIIAVNAIIIFSDQESRIIFSNLAVSATAMLALALALFVMYRQKIDSLSIQRYVPLAVGLILWFAAERTSTYYEIGVGTEASFPTFADVLRLIGYAFFAYYLFKTHKLFSKSLVPYWKLLALSMLFSAIAYSGSVYSVAKNIAEIWVWDLLYNASYICIANALFWHYRFFIFKKKDGEESGGKIINGPKIIS